MTTDEIKVASDALHCGILDHLTLKAPCMLSLLCSMLTLIFFLNAEDAKSIMLLIRHLTNLS